MFARCFTRVFKRCSQGVSQRCFARFLQCVYKVFTRGVLQCVYKRFAQEVGTRRFSNVLTTLPQVFCAMLPQGVYTLCKALYTIRTSVFARCLLNLYKCFWKVFTTLVHVCLKGVHSSCTCVVWKASTIYAHAFWKVFITVVQVFFWKASTTFAQMLRAQLLHNLYRCFCQVLQQLHLAKHLVIMLQKPCRAPCKHIVNTWQNSL